MRIMRKRNYVGTVFLLLLVAAAVYLAVRFYPVWKAAEYMQRNLDLAHCSYELEVALDPEKLPEGQEKLFDILTNLTGFEKADMCSLTLKGRVWEERVHVLIYPGNGDSPLAELYLGNDIDVINETLTYNAIRNHLTEKVGALGLVMPEQKEELYMTLEQVEQVFGIDLKGIRNFSLPTEDIGFTAGQYFLMMAAMSREKADGREHFALETEQLGVLLEVPGTEGTEALKFRLDVEDPAGLMEREAKLLTLLNIPAEGKRLEMVKHLSATIVQGGEEISMPTDFVGKTVVDLLSGLREWVMKFQGGSTGEPGAL